MCQKQMLGLAHDIHSVELLTVGVCIFENGVPCEKIKGGGGLKCQRPKDPE